MIMQSYQNGLNVLGRVGVELYRNKPDITYKFIFYSISFAVDGVESSAQSSQMNFVECILQVNELFFFRCRCGNKESKGN